MSVATELVRQRNTSETLGREHGQVLLEGKYAVAKYKVLHAQAETLEPGNHLTYERSITKVNKKTGKPNTSRYKVECYPKGVPENVKGELVAYYADDLTGSDQYRRFGGVKTRYGITTLIEEVHRRPETRVLLVRSLDERIPGVLATAVAVACDEDIYPNFANDVASPKQGKGLGSTLNRDMLGLLAAAGVEVVLFEVAASNHGSIRSAKRIHETTEGIWRMRLGKINDGWYDKASFIRKPA